MPLNETSNSLRTWRAAASKKVDWVTEFLAELIAGFNAFSTTTELATPQKADAIRQTLAESNNHGSSKLSNIVKNTTEDTSAPSSEEKPKWLMWVSVAFLLIVFIVAAYFLIQSL